MSHPPLPPNCELFGLYHDGVAFFRYTSSGIGHTYPLEDKDERYWKNNPDIRTLAASVARCFWIDEEMKWEAAMKGMCPYPSPWKSVPEWNNRNSARENAKAWKNWGNQK